METELAKKLKKTSVMLIIYKHIIL